jgi:hypothetical protein
MGEHEGLIADIAEASIEGEEVRAGLATCEPAGRWSLVGDDEVLVKPRRAS